MYLCNEVFSRVEEEDERKRRGKMHPLSQMLLIKQPFYYDGELIV